jgi:hypothetical protein
LEVNKRWFIEMVCFIILVLEEKRKEIRHKFSIEEIVKCLFCEDNIEDIKSVLYILLSLSVDGFFLCW